MEYKIDNIKYNVIIDKKNNKNTYIRIGDNLDIKISTNYLTTKSAIIDLLDKNYEQVKKMIDRKKYTKNNEDNFYYLGQKYDIIIVPSIEEVILDNGKIYTKNMEYLNKWLNKEVIRIFNYRLKYCYDDFIENIPYPKLGVRKMKTRWGVCNKKNTSITLNSNLINYTTDKIDYVIIHELSHLIHFNHSKSFWEVVNKYCPNYKKIRKELKE